MMDEFQRAGNRGGVRITKNEGLKLNVPGRAVRGFCELQKMFSGTVFSMTVNVTVSCSLALLANHRKAFGRRINASVTAVSAYYYWAVVKACRMMTWFGNLTGVTSECLFDMPTKIDSHLGSDVLQRLVEIVSSGGCHIRLRAPLRRLIPETHEKLASDKGIASGHFPGQLFSTPAVTSMVLSMIHNQEQFITSMCSSNEEKCNGFRQEKQPQSSMSEMTTLFFSNSTFQATIDAQHWIHTEGRNCKTVPSMVRSLGLQMRKQGFPVDRIFLGTILIHPQAAAFGWKWEADGKESNFKFHKDMFEKLRENTQDAPLDLLEVNDSIRIKATDTYIPPPSRNIFEDEGYVDMYGLPYRVRNEYGGGITWTTKRPCGFSSTDISFFNAIMPALSLLIHLLLNDLCMSSILKTYLGNDPGARVHSGSIERGDCITVRSVIWFCDIRGFSELSSIIERDELIEMVNQVFELTEAVLSRKGGEVLKFLGDGLMGVFTVDDGEEALVCQRAREAAEMVQTALKEFRATRASKGLQGVEMGIGLHFGDASYGNIGSPNRMDFTLIGQSVNVTSRIEGLCSTLKVSVLASEDFVDWDSGKDDIWSTCGMHQLKGVAEPVEVFELSKSPS